MKRKKYDLLWLWISIISYFLMSASFLIMPLDNMIPELKNIPLTLIAGGVFWGFLIIGAAAQIVLAGRRKAWYKSQHLSEKQSSVRKIGLIAFATGKLAAAADIIAVLSLGGLIIAALLTKAAGYVCYVLLAVFCFAFCMHCILNGKIYHHITHHYKNNNEHNKSEGEQRQ